MSTHPSEPQWWADSELRTFISPATVHEAAGRVGVLPERIRPVDASFTVWGPAFTIACPPGNNLWLHRAIYEAPPGAVLVADVGTSDTAFGYWGEILSEAAAARRLGGLVINGGSRDAAQLAGVGFPVFSAGLCIRGTIKDTAPWGRLVGEIRLGDVDIRTGDLVCGDRDGVVVVPASDVSAVVKASRARETEEMAMIEKLRNGARTLDLMGLA